MKRTKIKELLARETPLPQVTIMGWVRSVRSSKNVAFIALNDGSCLANIQVVFNPQLDNYETIRKTTIGSCLSITGSLGESPARGQRWELTASTAEVLGSSPNDFPLQKKYQSFEFLRSIAHLRPRTNTFGAIFRIRNTASYAIHNFFYERGFVYVHTPIITGSDCEGAGDMFHVTTLDLQNGPQTQDGPIDFKRDFFGRETSLTVSGQLEAEVFALGLGDVYTFSPTFRAENSNTSRHASEFWMIEPEMAFYDLDDTIELAWAFLQHLTEFVLQNCTADLEFLNERIENTLIQRLRQISEGDYQTMSYTEAITFLEKAAVDFEFPVHWGIDLQSEHERYLTEEVVKGPLFVIDYPKEIKPFYMRLNDDRKTVAALDLLVPKIGEIIGGSQREERYDILQQRIAELGFPMEDYWWYLELRKFGSAPHSGFGLGFARCLMYLTGMANIRDVIPFPRTPGHAEF